MTFDVLYSFAYGAFPATPETHIREMVSNPSRRINIYMKYYGITIGTMAYQGSLLAGLGKTLADRNLIIFSLVGGLATSYLGPKHAATIFKTQNVVNFIIGAISVCYGHYAFGLTALLLSGKILFDSIAGSTPKTARTAASPASPTISPTASSSASSSNSSSASPTKSPTAARTGAPTTTPSNKNVNDKARSKNYYEVLSKLDDDNNLIQENS